MNHNPYNNYMKKYLLSFLIISSGVIFAEDTVENIFKVNYKNQLFMDVEVALAEAYNLNLELFRLGLRMKYLRRLILNTFLKKISIRNINLVRHTLVARLNVWKRSIDKDAAENIFTMEQQR